MAKRQSIVLQSDEGERLWYDGGLLTFKAVGAKTEGALLLFEIYVPGGKATPLHVHPDADETFYLLEGEVLVHIDGTECSVATGGVVQVPRGTPHAFAVRSATARMIVMFTPADAVSEAYFRAAGEPATAPSLAPTAPDLVRLQTAAAQTGLKVLGPPPFAPSVPANSAH
jgi:quercetin dioxygenase-like cupin family protein